MFCLQYEKIYNRVMEMQPFPEDDKSLAACLARLKVCMQIGCQGLVIIRFYIA
jgi:hypothetical protein